MGKITKVKININKLNVEIYSLMKKGGNNIVSSTY